MKTSKKHFKKPTKDSSLRRNQKDVTKDVKKLLKYGHTVQVISRGNNSMIKCNGIPMPDYDQKDVQFNVHIWRQVNNAIYKAIETHPTVRYDQVHPYSTRRELKVGDKVCYVDIKHCYLQVAFKLGYIEEKDYKRILKDYSKTKIQVCAAITSLFREVRSDYFNEKGKIERTVECNNYFLDDAQNNIINYSRKIMFDYCHAGMDYYYRNVDGIVVPYEDRHLIKGYIKNTGLAYKIIEGEFVGNGMIFNALNGELEDCL